jgi:hypothetical protein
LPCRRRERLAGTIAAPIAGRATSSRSFIFALDHGIVWRVVVEEVPRLVPCLVALRTRS